MDDEAVLLDANEERVLRFVHRLNERRVSIEQLTEGTGLSIEIAERALSSLNRRGLVEVKKRKRADKAKEPSFDVILSELSEKLNRLSKLAAKKESTKATIYDRVRERLNDEASKIIANLEFAVDRTHDAIAQLTKEIEEIRDQLDEVALMVEIGELSEEEGDKKAKECREKAVQLELGKRGVIEERALAKPNASSRKWREDEELRLRGLLEELDVRKEVGEFDGRPEEYGAKRDKILADLAILTGGERQIDAVVRRGQELVDIGRNLASGNVFAEAAFNRLSRALEKIIEMSLSEGPDR